MEHGPKGGVGGISEIREYATLDGEVVGTGEDAKPSIKLPPWYRRTGRTLFEVDTGFGTVKCKAVAMSESKIMSILRGDDGTDLSLVFRTLVAVPDWAAEEDTKIGDVVFKVGDTFPPLEDVKGTKAQGAYIRNVLPPSAVVQIMTGLRFVSLPPIPYTEASPS